METVDSAPFWLAKKDGSCFFDQLSLAPSLRDLMRRPKVRIAELIDGMPLAELCNYLLDGTIDAATDLVTPVNATWAMGFAWSSFVAQSVMVGCSMRTGLLENNLLSDANQIPDTMDEVVAIVTDDVMHGRCWMDSLEHVLAEENVKSNPSKDTAGVNDGNCVGIHLLNGRRLDPDGDKLAKYIMATADLFKTPFAAPLEIGAYAGTVQWFDLPNRCFLVWTRLMLIIDRIRRRSSRPSSMMSSGSSCTTLRSRPSGKPISAGLGSFWEADFCRP